MLHADPSEDAAFEVRSRKSNTVWEEVLLNGMLSTPANHSLAPAKAEGESSLAEMWFKMYHITEHDQ